ncbi:ankyrin repeat-containing domain protein [Neocallimastix lanati (nom. inval.)]|nr:ankyrin repeat-containing domain protein [Neocallimastix sp. JGI-2020a]
MELTEFFEFEDNIYVKSKKIMYKDIELKIEKNASLYELFNQLMSKVKKLDCVYDKNNYYYRTILKLLYDPFLLNYEIISEKIIEIFVEIHKYIEDFVNKKNILLSLAIADINNIDFMSHFPESINDYVLSFISLPKNNRRISKEDYIQLIRFKNEYNILNIQYTMIFQILIKYLDYAIINKNNKMIKQFDHLSTIKEKVELINACRNNDIEKAKKILDKDLYIRYNTYDGKTIFDIPINNENDEFIKFLISYKYIDLYVHDIKKRIPIKNAYNLINKSCFNILLERMMDSYTYRLGMKTTLLIWAISYEEKEVYNYILKKIKPKNINLTDSSNRSALLWAIKKKNREVVDILLSYPDIDVNICDKYGNTPILLTAIHQDIITMKKLIKDFNVDVNEKNNFGNTPLIIATDKKYIDIANILIENKNIDINAHNNNKITALMYAIFKDCNEIIFKILKQPNLDINAIDNKGNTVLMLASKKGNLQLVKAILKIPNININIKNSENKTAIVYAIEKGMHKVMTFLLQQNDIIINTVDINGNTPITSFIKINSGSNMNFLKILLKVKKLDVNMVDNDLRSPLILACEKNLLEVVKYLFKIKNININLQDKYKNTALIFAAINRNPEIIKILISNRNTDINKSNNIGKNALMLAIKDVKCVQLLLKRKDIDLNIRDRKGRTALYIAVEKKYIDSIKLLLRKKNLDPNIKDLNGVSPYDLAIKLNLNDVVKLLSKYNRTNNPNLKGIDSESSESRSCITCNLFRSSRRNESSTKNNDKSKDLSFYDSGTDNIEKTAIIQN